MSRIGLSSLASFAHLLDTTVWILVVVRDFGSESDRNPDQTSDVLTYPLELIIHTHHACLAHYRRCWARLEWYAGRKVSMARGRSSNHSVSKSKPPYE